MRHRTDKGVIARSVHGNAASEGSNHSRGAPGARPVLGKGETSGAWGQYRKASPLAEKVPVLAPPCFRTT